MKKKIKFYLVFCFILLNVNFVYALSEDDFIKKNIDLINKSKITKLQLNYIYNSLLDIVEEIKNNKNKENTEKDYLFLIEFINSVSELKINEKEKKEIWLFLNNEYNNAEKILYDIKYEMF